MYLTEYSHLKVENSVPAISLPLYVSCGADTDYKDARSVIWVPFATGGFAATSTDITNHIAATERYWPSVTPDSGEKIVVGSIGIYIVTIYLAERYFHASGQRLFNIYIGDGISQKLFPQDIDLYNRFGYGNLHAFSVNVTVTTGTINILMVQGAANYPKLSGFSIAFKSPLPALSASPSVSPSVLSRKPPTVIPSVAPTVQPSTPKPLTTFTPSRTPTRWPSKTPSKRPTTPPFNMDWSTFARADPVFRQCPPSTRRSWP